jgi:hypothetical protein
MGRIEEKDERKMRGRKGMEEEDDERKMSG